MCSITICIPTYNRKENLTDCLSFLCQKTRSLNEFKIFVSDNGSPYDVQKVISRFQDELDPKLNVNPKNIGHVKNFEFLLKKCSSTYCLLLCDDDWIIPEIDV